MRDDNEKHKLEIFYEKCMTLLYITVDKNTFNIHNVIIIKSHSEHTMTLVHVSSHMHSKLVNIVGLYLLTTN